ncbi:MAG: YfiR family protein [Deltaproteobacteria bacterium]|nr:YfiR family protein [Deltaproteobacteria bacterium]
MRSKGFIIIMLFVLLSGLLCAIPAQTTAAERVESREYPLKAAFVYNFLKFTRWANEGLLSEHRPLLLGVAGPNYFGDALLPLEKKSVAGRPIILTYGSNLDWTAVVDCQVVFITFQKREQFSHVLDEVAGRPVLTISDAPGFARQGGCIELVKQQGKISFIINRGAIEKQGLALSYKVYSMALEVIGDEV